MYPSHFNFGFTLFAPFPPLILPVKASSEIYIREIKIHVYSIRQTANVSGEFLRIENKQLRKVQNDSCGQN